MKDALGNKIIIGGCYGYSTCNNGITRTVIGLVVNETSKRVTLKVVFAYESLYGNFEMEHCKIHNNVSIYGFRLFPVNIENINLK